MTLGTAPLLLVAAPPRLTLALASGAEVRPLLEVALALERTVLTGVVFWVAGASAAPVLAEREVVTLLEGVSGVVAAALPAERVVPLSRLAAVLPEVVLALLRRVAVVPVLPVLPLLPVLRFTWLPVVVVPVLLLRRLTWVEVLPEGAAVFLVAVLP